MLLIERLNIEAAWFSKLFLKNINNTILLEFIEKIIVVLKSLNENQKYVEMIIHSVRKSLKGLFTSMPYNIQIYMEKIYITML